MDTIIGSNKKEVLAEQLKKHHHYVWKKYLKPWTNENKIICQRNEKQFITSLDNIAQKRFFYKTLELGREEINFLKTVIENMIPDVAQSMNYILNIYNLISYSDDEYLIKCGIEDLHTIIENYGKSCLEKLQQGNIQFLNQDKEKYQLSLFLGVQYLRTNKMRQNLNPVELKNKKIDLEKLAVILPFIYGEIIARWIYNEGKIQLLKNSTSLNFITSDQPIFNTKGKVKQTDTLNEFELYYPVTPNYAVYISKNNCGKPIKDRKDVSMYNNLVKKHSFEQVFAKKKSDLI